MCSQVQCERCGKPTWAGCGRHIEQALANVPEARRCRCREDEKKKAASGPQPATRRKFFGLF